MQNYNSNGKSDLKGRCYKFSLELIKLIDLLSQDFSGKVIAHQLIRSGTSVGANLVEATASASRIEFKKFHEIALKSANETKYWLLLLKDSGKVPSEKIDILLQEITELSNMIAAGILRLKGKR